MKIYFTKMHGLGNDFMVIDSVRQNFRPDPKLIKQWARRHTGIGFDQLLLVEARKNKKADYFYRIFNADGSEVAQCGNGARCIAKFLHEAKLCTQNIMRVETIAGILELQLEADGQVTVDMGKPVISAQSFQWQDMQASVLSLGNPHCVFKVEQFDSMLIKEIGSALNKQHPDFPQGVNVGFIRIMDKKHIKLRVYERGVGETLACGSGACAAVVAGHSLNLLDEQVMVEQLGGDAQIQWAGSNTSVRLTGPAITVFNGEIEI